jgi:CubicO group peptidase (beta-lactamase class C family)
MRQRALPRLAAVLCLTATMPLSAAAPLPAQQPSRQHAEQQRALAGLDAYIHAAMRDWEVPGLALAVVRNDSVIFAGGYGTTALGGAAPVDEHTLFAIASTTKAMTVAAVGMLVDDGIVTWDDPVTRHLPWLQLRDPYVTRELTIRDLLTHRSGLSRNDELWISAPFDRGEVLRRARHLEQAAGFRAEYGYNNIMYIAAGEVVGAASGLSWDEFLEQRLFTPLGMTRSTSRTAVVEARGNVAESHTRVDGRVTAVQRRDYDNIGGAGAVFSSAHDMAQWLRLHLNGGTYEGRRLLSPRVVAEMHAPQALIRSDTVTERMFPATHFQAYGLGWRLHDYHGHKVVHHSGSINWTRTHVAFVPGAGIGVVIIANLSTSNLQQALAYRILDELLGLPPRDWSAEYLELARRGDARSAEQARETEAARVRGTRPSLEAQRYAGTYDSALHGEMRLEWQDGRLVLHYSPDYVADLEHWNFDTFRATWRRPGFGRAFVTFALDARGRVASMRVEGFGEFRPAPAPTTAAAPTR